MFSFLSGLVLTLMIIVGTTVLFVTVFLPLCGAIFRFIGRIIRFFVQETTDLILIPVALLVCIIKVLRAGLCVVLARWDIANIEIRAAQKRFNEAWNRLVALLIDNPLRVLAIEPSGQAKQPQVNQRRGTPTPPSKKFEGYNIVGTLQSGGSGAKIYIANSNHNKSQVVIKCFDIRDGSALPQIVRESRSMQAAKGLGLIIEHHLTDERFWYAMPYHNGDHLGVVTASLHGSSSHLNNQCLRKVLFYQQTLLQTLREYHLAGLWHKDVKPDNIIVHDERAHLVDLGLVTPLASAMTLTTHGTEYFRDPELVRQAMRGVKVHQVDGSKFDVYSAGAVLYFMLENTFPPHGGLSGFSKNSPEGIRWIVRRAMSEYDKRYGSIEEMLADVETILHSKNVSLVRPADLPSMTNKSVKLDSVAHKKSIPNQTTPSTGGGPFQHVSNKTRPMGVFALLAAIIVGTAAVYSTTTPKDVENTTNTTTLSAQPTIFDITTPPGTILVLDDCAMASNPEQCKADVKTALALLTAQGWDITVDPTAEARTRVWLPENPQNTIEVATKLEHEQFAGILIFQEDENYDVAATLLTSQTTIQMRVVVE